ncbi:glycosyltransferase [Terracoccus luteus]|uniref:Glycosyltransferase involved in cell wall biosynthesis n=1 Tax=Terracoccus luteus TaxID=53356 RepID=A0A839PSF7_9MICO|nr:glycosyltransferase family 4 protein [Terracoccus luteus]MBB2985724.1 glycosyltransferase involved in cell wall biosynthesis [Terracoccus luteus]MCP2171376.1 glycosyltransferase involved in cell wall biosynthesis [Terracoccus luteus]
MRTAHLERALELAPADLIYGDRRYDFDENISRAVAERSRLEQAGDWRAAWLIGTRGYSTIEVNEPIALETVRRTAIGLASVAIADVLRRRRTTIVTYSIGNVPVLDLPAPSGKARLGRRLDLWLAPRLWRRIDRIAFGTDAAVAAYAESFGEAGPRTVSTVIPALPCACGCPQPSSEALGPRLLFLGDLSHRKGFDRVIAAWPEVRARIPSATLVVVGRGAMTDTAAALANDDERVLFIEDPPRMVVHEELRRATVVVLPSRPHRGWREQVGLPLIEGLAHGCTVVTTDETGIAGWLSAHGHHTVSDQDADTLLPDALVRSLSGPRDPDDVIADLPDQDGRLMADKWLFQG